MSCTTILVGKKASNDGSTMIARTDDGHYDVKKLVLMDPQKNPKTKYKTVNSHLEIELPDGAMPYTASPNVDPKDGIWAATGINAANVGMTATETITSNPRVYGGDPYVCYKEKKKKDKDNLEKTDTETAPDANSDTNPDTRSEEKPKDEGTPGGIGEEDIVTLVLPYIHSAREGVVRLGALLEQYGTYEANGIAFNDADEIWWLETIGGHHWMAMRVPDDVCVIMPNQFGMDHFDLDDALGEQKNHMCSSDLRAFIADNHLDLNTDGTFNPRNIFGSHTYSDHIYNTPRAWFMGRYLCPTKYRWDGENADFNPESDNIPWSLIPEKKVCVEDVKFLLSSNYQGTPYNPYAGTSSCKGKYRSIGINRTGVMGLCQIRGNMPEQLRGVEWISFGSTSFNALLPVYTSVSQIPAYLSSVTTDVSSENFYWASRLIGALADPNYNTCIQFIERYQIAVANRGREILKRYDAAMIASGTYDQMEKANDELCDMAKEETVTCLNNVVLDASQNMHNGFNRADN